MNSTRVIFRVGNSWIQVSPDIFGPDLGSNCLQTLSTDDTKKLSIVANKE